MKKNNLLDIIRHIFCVNIAFILKLLEPFCIKLYKKISIIINNTQTDYVQPELLNYEGQVIKSINPEKVLLIKGTLLFSGVKIRKT